jgi:predicted GIY-YIG superfamily endonuclease
MKTLYHVYKLYFEEDNKFYIGKTKELTRRIANHKKETMSGKLSKKCNWIRKNLLLNRELKYKILYTTNSEQEALDKESSLIEETLKENVNQIIDSRKHFKSREGRLRSTEISGKDYIVITKNGLFFRIHSLKKFGEENNINYKDLNAVAKGKLKSSNNLKVIYAEIWDSLEDKEKTIIIKNFKEYNPFKNISNAMKKRMNKKKKEYIIVKPDGSVEEVIGLSTYCKTNNLNDGNMYSNLKNGKYYKGYKVFYKEQYYNEGLQEEIPVANSSNSGKLQTDNAVDNPDLSQDIIINTIDPNGPNGYLRGIIATKRYQEKSNDQREISYTQVSGNGEDPKGS